MKNICEYKIYMNGVLFHKNISAVYKLYHTSFPDLIYVGSTKNVRSRFRQHMTMLLKSKHHSKLLQEICSKEGISGIEMDIIEPCIIGCLRDREQYYIDKIKCINTCKNSKSSIGYKHTQDTKEFLSKIAKGRKMPKHVTDRIHEAAASPNRIVNLRKARCRPVIQIDKLGCVIARYSSIIEAQKMTGIAYQSIQAVSKGNTNRKTAGGLYWRYAD